MGRKITPAHASGRFYLWVVAVCATAIAVLLQMEKVAMAGAFFWGVLGLMLFYSGLLGKSEEMVCHLVAFAPFINLLRGLAFYNVVGVLFGGVLTWHFLQRMPTLPALFRKLPLLWPVLGYVVVYYGLSLFNTRDYAVNIRLFELAFALVAIAAIARDRAVLARALKANLICAWAVGLALLSHIAEYAGRLGVTVMDGHVLGNPTQLGIPLALGFLGIIIDGGKSMNLESKPLTRWLMLVPTLPLLALTTSRSSWLVAANGLFLNFAFGKRQQMKMVFTVALIVLAVNVVLITPFGTTLQKGFERTFGGNRTNAQRTSGRSDQWRVAWHAFSHSPETMLLGHGPGNGPEVYAEYSGEVAGVKYAVGRKVALHSLFMEIAVEAGLLGLVLMAFWLLLCFEKIWRRMRKTGEIFSLVCFLGYVFIVITVSGNDINSGIFLGIAMLGTAAVQKISPARMPIMRRSLWKPAWTH